MSSPSVGSLTLPASSPFGGAKNVCVDSPGANLPSRRRSEAKPSIHGFDVSMRQSQFTERSENSRALGAIHATPHSVTEAALLSPVRPLPVCPARSRRAGSQTLQSRTTAVYLARSSVCIPLRSLVQNDSSLPLLPVLAYLRFELVKKQNHGQGYFWFFGYQYPPYWLVPFLVPRYLVY